jgi:hypothetical protein
MLKHKIIQIKKAGIHYYCNEVIISFVVIETSAQIAFCF